jgi:hypothetical protein
MKWLGGTHEETFKIVGVPAETQTGHLPNVSQKRYYFSQLPRPSELQLQCSVTYPRIKTASAPAILLFLYFRQECLNNCCILLDLAPKICWSHVTSRGSKFDNRSFWSLLSSSSVPPVKHRHTTLRQASADPFDILSYLPFSVIFSFDVIWNTQPIKHRWIN